MENVSFIEVVNPIVSTSEVYAIIDKGNGEYISMPKSVFDELNAKDSEGITNEATAE
jgi:predicted aspartyl protease